MKNTYKPYTCRLGRTLHTNTICNTTESVAPQLKTLSELVSEQEMVVVLAHVYNEHLSTCPGPSAISIMLGVVASVASTHHHQT